MKHDFSHHILFIIITPLVLSAFTHLWNPIGFPTLHVDEGHYMRRAMQVLRGLGPQELTSSYIFAYDHPYFGQLFLAGALKIIGYPDSSVSKNGDVQSIETLYSIPRVLMGFLAIIDTFLVYKIAEKRYNRNVGFMASILFAVMPMGWMTRGIFLDSILLPFFLSSILFALYTVKTRPDDNHVNGNANLNKNRIMILMSGIFLGLAIFTKAPIFTMIPLLAVIILKNNRDDFKFSIVLWLIPVIIIPLLWPSYTIVNGHFEEWLKGVTDQAHRVSDNTLFSSIMILTKIDPIMLIIGLAGFAYTQIKRDYFLTLWVVPYLIFLYLIGWVTHFHWILLLPALCISAAILFEDISGRVKRNKITNVTRMAIITAFAIFGLTITTSLITLNLNSSYFETYSFTVNEIKDQSQANNYLGSNGTLTVIGDHRIKALTWIPQYVMDLNFYFRDVDNPKDNFTEPLKSNEKVIFVADSNVWSRLGSFPNGNEKDTRIGNIYYGSFPIATFINRDYDTYEFINTNANHGLGRYVEIKVNYK